MKKTSQLPLRPQTKFYRSFYTATPSTGMIIDEPSKTIEGMEQPLSKILERLHQGQVLSVGNGMDFHDNHDEPMPRVRDLTDIDALKAELKAEEDRIIEIVKREQAAKKPDGDPNKKDPAGSSPAVEPMERTAEGGTTEA